MNNSSIKELPVQFHDEWILNDTHHFFCEDMLSMNITADLIYTDPPWNQSVLDAFYKRASLPSEPFESFINKRVAHMKELCPKGLIFIEFGLRTFPVIQRAFENNGASLLCTAFCTYTSQYIKQNVSCFSFDSNSPEVYIPENLHEWDVCKYILSHYSKPNQIMLEPFCGMGYQARIGIANGLILRGIEVIPSKFQKIILKTKGDWKCQRR